MELISITSLIISIAGGSLGAISKLLKKVPLKKDKSISSGTNILKGFLIIVLAFGIVTAVFYWKTIFTNMESLLFFFWLFLTMLAGMFVQVISSNYQNGKELFKVTASQLIYPTLFSLIVFYPIWSISSSSAHGLFSFYTAFLNGFFWETVVNSTKPPEGEVKPG